jgi:hypothetical protein
MQMSIFVKAIVQRCFQNSLQEYRNSDNEQISAGYDERQHESMTTTVSSFKDFDSEKGVIQPLPQRFTTGIEEKTTHRITRERKN